MITSFLLCDFRALLSTGLLPKYSETFVTTLAGDFSTTLQMK
jgi:hypothetical protein